MSCNMGALTTHGSSIVDNIDMRLDRERRVRASITLFYLPQSSAVTPHEFIRMKAVIIAGDDPWEGKIAPESNSPADPARLNASTNTPTTARGE